MSSWIPSLFNPSSDDDDPTSPTPSSPNKTGQSLSSGVKEDLSAVFRGFTAFLAPQPALIPGPSSSSETIAGIKNDLAEIQGSFKSGFSLISSKFAPNFLQFQSQPCDVDVDADADEDDEEDVVEEEDAVGITEEVLDFVRKISGRPELWTDFPLSLHDDFDLSDYQREHAAYIDHLVPELVTLRQKICSQISDGKFWIVYFVLLCPRLNEEDLKLLSTPEVVEARETLVKKFQNKTDVAQETAKNPETSDSNKESGKDYSNEGDESPSQNKDVSAETVNATKQREIVKEMESENVENVSFSDLEDDDHDLSDNQSGHTVSKSGKVSRGEAHEWVQLNENARAQGDKQKADQSAFGNKESEGEDSNDWLTVDDTDFDSLEAI